LNGTGFTVVFLPMHSTSTDNDLTEIGIVRKLMKTASFVVGETLGPHEAASFLGSASIVVGLRLHSLILAASKGVPVVSVGYDEKIRGFMEYSGVDNCVSEPVELAKKALTVAARGEEVGASLRDSCSLMRIRMREEASTLVESLG
jgi:polysaccharide pyruvyl transferase WcaK-like protein